MTSMTDFLRDARCHPLLIYKADKLPACTVLERGSDGAKMYDSLWEIEWDWDPQFVVVICADTEIPERWMGSLRGVKLECIRVAPESIPEMVAQAEPHVCIWPYHNGPRPWCQFGGDEDWTAVVRTRVYYGDEMDAESDSRYYDDVLRLGDLGNRVGDATEGEFTVFTAAHA